MASMLEQWRGNQRLRLGTVLIVGILLSYGLLEWRDRLDAQRTEYKSLLSQLARVHSDQGQAQWLARATEAVQANDAARASLWRHGSVGLAQAQVQDWLQRLLRETAAKSVNLKVVEAEGALDASGARQADLLPPELKLLRARVEFAAEPPVLLAVLGALNEAEYRVVFDSMTVKAGKVELGLNFWFLIQANATAVPADGASAVHSRGMLVQGGRK